MTLITLPYPVPYYAQVASPELALPILEKRLPAEQDPRWVETGAASPQDYAYWAFRACGVACVKMCVEALGGPVYSLVDWANRGVQAGGYLTREDAAGQLEEVGWLHRSLAALIRGAGYHADSCDATPNQIVAHLRAGKMVIASVSYELGTLQPVTRRGGHLVVVIGAELENGRPSAFLINNPSGRHPHLRAGARIPIDRFTAAYTGRAIVAGPAA